jgi:hypothetical protein
MNAHSTMLRQRATPPAFTPVRSGVLQRKCACGTHASGGECEECSKQKQTLQPATRSPEPQTRNSNGVSPIVHEVLRSPGQPLDPATRAFFEPRFGHDFSQVRVYTDARAAESARAVNARAYTLGENVVFGAGRFSSHFGEGRRLLAHELTHVVQNRRQGNPAPAFLKAISHQVDASEQEAASAVQRIMNGDAVEVRESPNGVMQGDFGDVAKAAGIGLAVAGGVAALGLGIAALAGAFKSDKTYEEYVQEAVDRLSGVSFGVAGTGELDVATLCVPPLSGDPTKSFDYWYDQRFWEPAIDTDSNGSGKKSCKLVLMEGADPAKAIDELFDHQERWHVACAEFVQITELYALRHTLGDEGFRKRVQTGGKRLELRRRASSGVVTKVLYTRTSAGDKMIRSTDHQIEPRGVEQILAEAPIGSRVRWTNADPKALGTAWENENTVKLGPDEYAAHPLYKVGIFVRKFPWIVGPNYKLSRRDIESRTAQETNPNADDAYIKSNIFISEIEYFATP